jgi:hypothetical protein
MQLLQLVGRSGVKTSSELLLEAPSALGPKKSSDCSDTNIVSFKLPRAYTPYSRSEVEIAYF